MSKKAHFLFWQMQHLILEQWLGGHVNIGKNITIFGFNAMACASNISTKKWGYICFRPTTYFRGRWRKWYFYVSPDGTPQRSTFAIGPGVSELNKISASVRRYVLGHNFSTIEEVCDWNREMTNSLERCKYGGAG